VVFGHFYGEKRTFWVILGLKMVFLTVFDYKNGVFYYKNGVLLLKWCFRGVKLLENGCFRPRGWFLATFEWKMDSSGVFDYNCGVFDPQKGVFRYILL
jgi:hypothetical protein